VRPLAGPRTTYRSRALRLAENCRAASPAGALTSVTVGAFRPCRTLVGRAGAARWVTISARDYADLDTMVIDLDARRTAMTSAGAVAIAAVSAEKLSSVPS
jgi:hypothetical protein